MGNILTMLVDLIITILYALSYYLCFVQVLYEEKVGVKLNSN